MAKTPRRKKAGLIAPSYPTRKLLALAGVQERMRGLLLFVAIAALSPLLLGLAFRPTETRVRGESGVMLVERAAEIPSDWESMPLLDEPSSDNVAVAYDQDMDSVLWGGGSSWSTRGWELSDFRVGAARANRMPPLRLTFECRHSVPPGFPYCDSAAVRRRPFEGGWLYVVTIHGGATFDGKWPVKDDAIGAFVRLPAGSTFPKTGHERWPLSRSALSLFMIGILAAAATWRIRAYALRPRRAPPPSTIYRDRPPEERESPRARTLRLRAWALVVASACLAAVVCFPEW